jgi:hypothetical protein
MANGKTETCRLVIMQDGKTVWALILLLALAGSVLAFDTPDWMIRVGTVPHAITLADGSHVCLDAVEIEKIGAKESPAYLVIKDWFDPHSKLLVMTQPSPELRMGQTIDVEGTISTLEDGRRAIVNPTVLGYTDEEGNLLLSGPRMKGFDEPFPWEWKIDLTVSGEFLMSGTPREELLDSLSEELCETIADAKAVSDGTAVELRCKPITSIDSGFFIMGEDGSSDTLKVYYSGTVSVADRIRTITGTIQTEDSERVLDVDSGPEYDPQIFVGSIQTATDGTIEWVKTWPDGHVFGSGDITDKIVTRDWTDYFYIEQDDRSCGIRIEKTAHGRHRDDKVDIEGTLGTNSDLERYIAATTVTLNGSGSLTPVLMIQRSLGGGDCAYLPGPPASGQRGTKDAHGVNNIGLLLTALGKVTVIDTGSPPQWVRIDDGSLVEPKIAYPPYGISVDDYVIVSGISSCEYDDENDWLLPVLRPQPLTVTINQASGQSDPTNTTPINFTVVFGEPVTDFDDADDVEITGDAGGTKTVAITPVGSEGKEYNVAISGMTDGTVIASIPCGKALGQSGVWNYESTSTDNSVLFDGSAPSTPSNVSLDHVIPTSRRVRGQWDASSDGGSGLKDYLYQFYYVDAGGEHTLTSWTATTETSAICTLGFDPSVTDGKTYHIRVKARDNALNEGAESASSGVNCQKAQVAYMYYFADVVWETYPPTDGLRRHVNLRLTNTANANSTIMQYTQLQSFPTSLDTYDVLVISCPDRNKTLTTDQMNQIAAWANAWHHRLVLVGDSSTYRLCGDCPYGYFNNRLNEIAAVVSPSIPQFKTSQGNIPSPYNVGTCHSFQYHRPWLLTGVTELKFASPGWFNFDSPQQHPDWIAQIDSAYRWIIERDLDNGGMCLAIHDMNVFDTANTSSSHANFARNLSTKFE